MQSKIIFLTGVCSLLILSISWGGKMHEKTIATISIQDISECIWKRLSEKKIYFAHMSVGNNIIDGIKKIMASNKSLRLNIIDTNDPGVFNQPVFAHSSIGKNDDPVSKIEAFRDNIDKGIGNKADIAFFKLCYVDVTARADVQRIFSYYKSIMKCLKDKYPKTTFIHVTLSLTWIQTGPKVWVKKLIGRPIGGYADNIKRNEFNDRLRKEYERREPIFDLAGVESTFPDGKRALFTEGGKIYQAMVPEYTDDGGHLNERGRKFVAQQLLILLANLSERS